MTRFQMFKHIFLYNLPDLCEVFEEEKIYPESYMMGWMMTMYAQNLSVDMTARIWDVYMVDGVKALYRAAIVILRYFEDKLMESSFEEMMRILKEIKNVVL